MGAIAMHCIHFTKERRSTNRNQSISYVQCYAKRNTTLNKQFFVTLLKEGVNFEHFQGSFKSWRTSSSKLKNIMTFLLTSIVEACQMFYWEMKPSHYTLFQKKRNIFEDAFLFREECMALKLESLPGPFNKILKILCQGQWRRGTRKNGQFNVAFLLEKGV